MNLPSKILAAGLLAAAPMGMTANGAPIGASLALHEATNSAVQMVQWRDRWGGWGDWSARNRFAWSGPAAAGLAAGALVGGAFAASPGYDYDYGPTYTGFYTGYGPDYYGYNPGYSSYSYSSEPGYPGYGYSSGGRDAAYCVQRYRSYDPASGTYLGYDGIRHPCP